MNSKFFILTLILNIEIFAFTANDNDPNCFQNGHPLDQSNIDYIHNFGCRESSLLLVKKNVSEYNLAKKSLQKEFKYGLDEVTRNMISGLQRSLYVITETSSPEHKNIWDKFNDNSKCNMERLTKQCPSKLLSRVLENINTMEDISTKGDSCRSFKQSYQAKALAVSKMSQVVEDGLLNLFTKDNFIKYMSSSDQTEKTPWQFLSETYDISNKIDDSVRNSRAILFEQIKFYPLLKQIFYSKELLEKFIFDLKQMKKEKNPFGLKKLLNNTSLAKVALLNEINHCTEVINTFIEINCMQQKDIDNLPLYSEIDIFDSEFLNSDDTVDEKVEDLKLDLKNITCLSSVEGRENDFAYKIKKLVTTDQISSSVRYQKVDFEIKVMHNKDVCPLIEECNSEEDKNCKGVQSLSQNYQNAGCVGILDSKNKVCLSPQFRHAYERETSFGKAKGGFSGTGLNLPRARKIIRNKLPKSDPLYVSTNVVTRSRVADNYTDLTHVQSYLNGTVSTTSTADKGLNSQEISANATVTSTDPAGQNTVASPVIRPTNAGANTSLSLKTSSQSDNGALDSNPDDSQISISDQNFPYPNGAENFYTDNQNGFRQQAKQVTASLPYIKTQTEKIKTQERIKHYNQKISDLEKNIKKIRESNANRKQAPLAISGGQNENNTGGVNRPIVNNFYGNGGNGHNPNVDSYDKNKPDTVLDSNLEGPVVNTEANVATTANGPKSTAAIAKNKIGEQVESTKLIDDNGTIKSAGKKGRRTSLGNLNRILDQATNNFLTVEQQNKIAYERQENNPSAITSLARKELVLKKIIPAYILNQGSLSEMVDELGLHGMKFSMLVKEDDQYILKECSYPMQSDKAGSYMTKEKNINDINLVITLLKNKKSVQGLKKIANKTVCDEGERYKDIPSDKIYMSEKELYNFVGNNS